jgi:hypothetical protein
MNKMTFEKWLMDVKYWAGFSYNVYENQEYWVDLYNRNYSAQRAWDTYKEQNPMIDSSPKISQFIKIKDANNPAPKTQRPVAENFIGLFEDLGYLIERIDPNPELVTEEMVEKIIALVRSSYELCELVIPNDDPVMVKLKETLELEGLGVDLMQELKDLKKYES